MAQSATDDPIVNAVLRPEASRLVRLILRSALNNPDSALTSDEIAQAQALYANVIMNDVLNWWNEDLLEAGNIPQTVKLAQDFAGKALTFDAKLPLALHARGLVKRAQGDQQGAFQDFDDARTFDSNFARAHAQAGNQYTFLNQPENSHGDLKKARDAAPHHPAIGYFDWGDGRAFFVQGNDWTSTIEYLERSVAELQTVWYNYLYLAAAQAVVGNIAGVTKAITDFRTAFAPNADLILQRAARVLNVPVADANDRVGIARQRVYKFLQTQGFC